MAVKAQLDGHQFDLEALAELFPSGDSKIVKAEEGYFLEATALDDLFQDAGRMRKTANSILGRINGYASIWDAGFRPVRLTNRYVNDRDGATHTHTEVTDEARVRDTATVVVVGTAEARCGALNARVAINGVIVEREPAGTRYLALASSNKDVAELLTLVGNANTLSWVELYKVYEIIRDAVGGGQKGLIATGWITKEELSAFTGTANHPHTSGPDGRHARGPEDTPTKTMTIEESRRVLRDLTNRWLDSLG